MAKLGDGAWRCLLGERSGSLGGARVRRAMWVQQEQQARWAQQLSRWTLAR